jgi:DNA-binding transcriptional LysR family regulator
LAIGRPNLDLAIDEQYEHFYLLIQAAACGLGIALVPRLLVEEELRRGHVVAPFGFITGPHKLNLWIAPHQYSHHNVRCLSNWIQSEMATQSFSWHRQLGAG